MIVSESEYLLISELISMVDRELAQKIELHIWAAGPVPFSDTLAKYVQALEDSPDGPEQFDEKAREILKQSGMEFVNTDADLRAKHPGFEHTEGNTGTTTPRKYNKEPEYMVKLMTICEYQEAKAGDDLDSSIKRVKEF